MKHVDDYIWEARSETEAYAKWILMHYRLPAWQKSMFKEFIKDKKLYCDYNGKTYFVIGASRLGDIWLSSSGDFPYEYRVNIEDVTNLRGIK